MYIYIYICIYIWIDGVIKRYKPTNLSGDPSPNLLHRYEVSRSPNSSSRSAKALMKMGACHQFKKPFISRGNRMKYPEI